MSLLVEVVRLGVHRLHAVVRGDHRDAVRHELVDVAPGHGRAVRHVGDHAQLHHPLDHRPARRRQPARQVHLGVRACRRGRCAAPSGIALGVARQLVGEEVRERERGDAALGELVQPREAPVAGRPSASPAPSTWPPSTVWTIAVLPAASTASSSAFERAISKRSPERRPAAPSRPSSAAGTPTRSASAACARRRRSARRGGCTSSRSTRRSGMCSDDHSTFTPPFSSILKSVRLASGLNVLPGPVVAAQVAVPQERVHRRVRVDVGQPGEARRQASLRAPSRSAQVVVHEHRGDQRPERVEAGGCAARTRGR